MKKIILTLLSMCVLSTTMAQTLKCGIDTKALMREEIAAGATSISFLAEMAPDYDQALLEKAGFIFGAKAGEIVTLRVPVESLHLLDENKDIITYSISHRIAQPSMDNTRVDTRTDNVQSGEGVTDSLSFNGEGVLIGITDWGFDYTHPNYNSKYTQNSRLERAWDHFRLAGPAPEGFTYGTEISGHSNLLNAHGDTSNLYGYGTHGTHVAGITAGRGADGKFRGQAPYASLLFCSFGLGEAAWLDGVAWMKKIAQETNRRIVVNSSWGMYSFSCLDGKSLLSRAINQLSDSGMVFVTSAGNNGDENFHIKRDFSTTPDTLKTVAAFYTYASDGIGQCLIMWGEEGHDFSAGFRVKKGDSIWVSPMFSTNAAIGDTLIVYDTLRCVTQIFDTNYIFDTIFQFDTISQFDTILQIDTLLIDTLYVIDTTVIDTMYYDTLNIPYRTLVERVNPLDQRPHIQIDVTADWRLHLQLQLYIAAESGTVHAWNVVNKTNHAGNEGAGFTSGNNAGFTAGDPYYGIGEPACAEKCISVAAHKADAWSYNHTVYYPGNLTYFSSYGPLIDGRQKPDISAPGQDVNSSISYWTTGNYYATATVRAMGRQYKWSTMSGTSMSSPAVTGIVALLLQANPTLTTDQIHHIITSTARNDEYTGDLVANDSADVRWGWGKIDALNAINEALRLLSINDVETMRLPLHLYPNPTTGMVTINTNCGEPQTVQVFTIGGQFMFETTVLTEATIDTRQWARGVYIVRAGSRVEKLIVR